MTESNTESKQETRPSWWNFFSSGSPLSWPAEVGSLLMRLYLGLAICFGAGLSKFPLDRWFAGQVEGLGFPLPTLFAWAAALSEVAGGVLLAVGLCTRPAAFFLAFTMGVAVFGFHKIPPLSVYTSQHITLLYFWGYVFFAFAGAGRLSLDGLLRRRGGVALGLAAAVTAGLAAYCASIEPPPAIEEATADFSEVESVVLAGSFNDWSLGDTPMRQEAEGVWTATVEVEAATPVEFKFVGNASWDLAAGETDQPDERFPVEGVAETGPGAGNVEAYLPRAGEYRFSVTLPSLEYAVDAVDETAQ